MATGQLQKMQIFAYSGADFSEPYLDEYDVLVNPDTYAISYEVITNDTTAPGNTAAAPNFNQVAGQKMTFKFLFDGTGVIRSGGGPGGINITPSILGDSAKKDVGEEITKFKKVVYNLDGDIHQPRYVQLRWGALHYNCRLQSMTLTFKLFKPDGYPLRAEADCTFISVIDKTKLNLIEKKKSPDLTHVYTVIDGDTLPLLCYREYGDSKYYYQIAQFNNLTDLKNLVPGTRLIFPPIAK